MSSLTKAHDLAYRLYCELEELKRQTFPSPLTAIEIERLYEEADGLQSDLYDLLENEI